MELKTARINSLRLLLIILLAPLIACDGSSNGPKPNDVPGLSPSINTSPDNKNDGWIVSTAVNEGFDEAAITSILTSIRDGAYPGVDSVVMAKNGMLVAEAYYNGYGPDTLHDLRSTSKSITSALAGVAIEEGVLELNHTLDDLILNLGEYDNPDEKREQIEIINLLNMRSGLDCNDWNSSSRGNEERMYKNNNWINFVLNLRALLPPGVHAS